MVDAWWDSSWQYRQKLTITSGTVGENLTDFPVRVHLVNDKFTLGSGQTVGMGVEASSRAEQQWHRFDNSGVDYGNQPSNDGTLSGGASYDAGVKAIGTHSLALDGIDGFYYVTTPYITIEAGENDSALTFWYKRTTASTNFYVGQWDDVNTGNRIMITDAGVINLKGEVTQAGFSTDDNWHFVAVVFDRSNTEIRFYEDAVYLGKNSGNMGGNINIRQLGRGSNDAESGYAYTAGHLDDLRTYSRYANNSNTSRLLTHQEIRWLYNSGSGRSGATLPRALNWSHYNYYGYDVRFASTDGTAYEFEREIFAPVTPTTNTGTVTGEGFGPGAGFEYYIIQDAAASFISWGVKPGMIIAHPDDGSVSLMSVVLSVESETELHVSVPYFGKGFSWPSRISWDDGDTYVIYPQAVFWVKIPTIAAASNTSFYVYYGNPNATDAEDPASVWSSSYKNVNLLSPNKASGYDSSGNSSNITYDSRGTQLNGSCGLWIFTTLGPTARLDNLATTFMNTASQDWTFTTSVRNKLDDAATNYIFDLQNVVNWSVYITGTSTLTFKDNESTGSRVFGGSLATGSYPPYQIAIGYNNTGVAYTYYGEVTTDAALVANASLSGLTASGSWTPPGGDNFIGLDNMITYNWIGEVGQIFIAGVRRSENWLKAEYLNMWSKTFIKYGGEEMGAPIIISVTTDGPKYGGETINYTINWYFQDDLSSDFYLCKTFGYSGGCTGGSWTSAITGETSSPSVMSFAVPATPADYNAYVFPVSSGLGVYYSRTFTVSPLHIDSVGDAPDPVYASQDTTFNVSWTWPARSVDVFVCRTASFSGGVCTGGEYGHSLARINTIAITYTTLGADIGTNNYYVYIRDNGDNSIVGDNNG